MVNSIAIPLLVLFSLLVFKRLNRKKKRIRKYMKEKWLQ